MIQKSLVQHTVNPEEIARKRSLGQAIEHCAELQSLSYDKELENEMRKSGCPVDKTQLSRWQSGSEGIKWEKLEALMDVCGNDAPLLWMLHQRGYDLHSIRRRETETERENRLLREEVSALRRILTGSAA
jgi:hypothetical protein